jgi:hypothetical protein
MADRLPSWQRQEQEDELETRQAIERQGELESRHRADYMMQGDVFGFEDGRPGASWNPLTLGLMMPFEWRLIASIAGVVLLVVLVLGWRACVGEERIEQLRGQSGAQPAAAQPADE